MGREEQIKECREQKLTYLQAHADAERRKKRKEKQVYCLTCAHYQWEANLCSLSETQSLKERDTFLYSTKCLKS